MDTTPLSGGGAEDRTAPDRAEAAAAALKSCDSTGALPPHQSGCWIPPWQIINEEELARAFGKHPASIKRAVERGELPPPVRLMGKPTWTGAAILKHLEARLEQARESAEVFNRHRASFQKNPDNER